MRTRSAPGRIVKCSGGSNTSASPSTPAGTELFDSTVNDGVIHCFQVGRCPLFASTSTATPSKPSSMRGPRSRADEPAQSVGVVRDHDDDGLLTGDIARTRVPQFVLARRRRADERGQGVEHRPQLRVAIAIALDRVCVQAEGHVVHEHPTVHLGQINETFAAVDECIECTHDVVAVDPEVERKVVPCARGYTRERQIDVRRRSSPPLPVSRLHRQQQVRRHLERRRRGPAPEGHRRAEARSARCLLPGPPRRGVPLLPDLGQIVGSRSSPRGWVGSAGGRATRVRNARRAATVLSKNRPIDTNASAKIRPVSSATMAAMSSNPARTISAGRTRPGRRNASHNVTNDRATSTAVRRPRGKTRIELITIAVTARARRTSAAMAASRRDFIACCPFPIDTSLLTATRPPHERNTSHRMSTRYDK